MHPKKIKDSHPKLDLEILILLNRASGLEANIKELVREYDEKADSDIKFDKTNIDRLEWKLRHVLEVIENIRRVK